MVETILKMKYNKEYNLFNIKNIYIRYKYCLNSLALLPTFQIIFKCDKVENVKVLLELNCVKQTFNVRKVKTTPQVWLSASYGIVLSSER